MKKILFLFTFSVAWLAFERCLAQGFLSYAQGGKPLQLYGALEVLPNVSSTMTFERLTADAHTLRFIPVSSYPDLINMGSNPQWLRFTIKNSSQGEDFLINAEFDFVELYWQEADGKIEKRKNGKLEVLKERSVYYGRTIYLPVKLRINEQKTFYLKVRNEIASSIQNVQADEVFKNVAMYPEAPIVKNFSYIRYFHGIYLGLMLIMFCYNLIMFFFFRDRSFIYYAFFIFFSCVNSATVSGFMLEFVWYNYPYFNQMSNFYFITLTWFFFIIFSNRFLNLKQYLPKWYKSLNYVAWAFLGMIILYLLDIWSTEGLIVAIIVAIVMIFAINIVAILRKLTAAAATYFLIANIIFLIGVSVSLLVYKGFIPSNGFTSHADEIGTALQVLIFSAGMANRMKMMSVTIEMQKLEQEKMHLNQEKEKQRIITQQKEDLETQVRNRTAELEVKNKELELQREETLLRNQELSQKHEEILSQKEIIESQKRSTESAYNKIKVLTRVAEKINLTIIIPEIFDIALESALEVLDISAFGVAVVNKTHQRLDFVGHYTQTEKQTEHEPIALNDTNTLIVWCAQNRKEIFINDFEKEHKLYIASNVSIKVGIPNPQSLIYIPLIIQDNVMGVLFAQNTEKNVYTEIDLDIIRTLASYVAIGIDNAQAYVEIQSANEALEQKNNQVLAQKKAVDEAYNNIQVLKLVGEKINSTLDIQEIYDTAFHSTKELISTDGFGIALVNKEANRLDFVGFYKDHRVINNYKISLEDHDRLIVWAVKNKQMVFVNDYEKDYPKYTQKPPSEQYLDQPRSLIYIPLLIQEEVTGVLLVRSENKNAYNQVHLEILANMASYVAIGINNAQAYGAIKEANEMINTTNVKIMDSLRYAKTIQEAILPEDEDFKLHFADFFVIFKPTDIVSGDFYWFAKMQKEQSNEIECLMLAVADCTGHGVPGAFMSMVGNTLLNEIVNQKRIIEPSRILRMMNRGIQRALKQDITLNNDGIDGAICRIEKWGEKSKITYSGAKVSAFYWQDDKITELKADRFSVGGSRQKHEKDFTEQVIFLQSNDILYISSDGLYDQHNHLKQKYGRQRFMQTLAKIAHLPLSEQGDFLNKDLEEHQGNQFQRDDITVLGVRF